MAMGAASRVTFVFKAPLWRDHLPGLEPGAQQDLSRMSFLFSPEELPGVWWTWMPDPAPVITAWVGGPQAQSGQPWIARSLQVLARMLGMSLPELQGRLLSSHYHDWQADPFSRGAYSYVPVGALECPRQMGEPVEQTLLFAGEHTDQGADWGTVHAALRSGMRAAAQAQLM
jgi:monoamine oxidase